MVKKIIFILLLGFVGLYAKSSVGACIPIGQIVILKKSIMRLDLSKEQKDKLVKYEEKLKDSLSDIKSKAYKKDERLSNLFDNKKFLKSKFLKITRKENNIISNYIAEYFQNMYKTLTPKQRVILIKRFKRMERKRNRQKTSSN